MSDLGLLAVIFGGLAVTYLTRLSFLLLVPPDRLPPVAQQALRYAPPSVLAAIILPELVLDAQGLALGPANPRLLAGLVAAFVAWRTKNTWLTMLLGLLALWLASTVIAVF